MATGNQHKYNLENISWEKIEGNFAGSHIVSVEQFTLNDVQTVFSVAEKMEPYANRQKVTTVLNGAVLSSLFFEPSTRTRISFGSAFARLGGQALETVGFEFSSFAKGESVFDTARVMAGYADVIAMRHPETGSVADFARVINIPVLNAGDGQGEHPTQALLDAYTIQKEFAQMGKTMDGATVALYGDLKYGRTVHSLIRILSLYNNISFVLVSPVGLEMPQSLVHMAQQNGHKVTQSNHVKDAITDVDVLYATRVQKERLQGSDGDIAYDESFQINARIFNQYAGDTTIIMHPLPRDSRDGAFDLSNDLNDDDRLAIFRQADNGIPVRMALFALTLGVDHQIGTKDTPVTWYVPEKYADRPR